MISGIIDHILRDYSVDGDPASPAHRVHRPDLRQYLKELELIATGVQSIVEETAIALAPTLAWIGTQRNCTNAAAITLTLSIPSAPIGSVIQVRQGGAGVITFVAGANTTINGFGSPTKTMGIRARANLQLMSYSGSVANWDLFGDVEA